MAEYSDNNNINSEEEIKDEVESTRLAGFVYNKFDESERARRSDEERWLEAFHNYRGKYYKNVHYQVELVKSNLQCMHIPAACRPLLHQCCPSSHHTQSPTNHQCTPPLYPHTEWSLQPGEHLHNCSYQ